MDTTDDRQKIEHDLLECCKAAWGCLKIANQTQHPAWDGILWRLEQAIGRADPSFKVAKAMERPDWYHED